MASDIRMAQGQMSWDSGVDSGRNPLIVSAANPDGLKANQLAWANNCSLRDGIITHRPGYEYVCTMPLTGLYQTGYMYEPAGEYPYLYLRIAGRSFTVKVDVTPAVITEITIPGDPDSPTVDQGWTVQGEEFLVDQDNTALPLFWDGVTLRRSLGPSLVVGIFAAPFTVPAVNAPQLATFTTPFQGQDGDLVYIGGKAYRATTQPGNFVSIETSVSSYVGSVIKAGALFKTRPGGVLVGETTADFIVPAAGVPVTVSLDPAYAGPLPQDLTLVDTYGGYLNLNTWQILALPLPAPGANQVYLINLTDIPATVYAAGITVETAAELPTGQSMDYYMGRIWIANGREYLAGDIVGSQASGTAAYGFRDSILKLTENAFTVSGGAFIVPTNAGNIRALKHPANLDTALGEGQLLPMTRRNIYSTNVSPTRADWVLLTEPIQRVAQINFGTVSDRSVAQVNGDLYYRSVDGVRSFTQAIRYFNAGPGNTPISHEMERLFSQDDRELLRFCSAVEFDNRLLTLAAPYTTPAGVAFKAIGVLNFDFVNSIQQKAPPAWEGAWEGLNFLQLLKGDFGGRQRCFAPVWSELNQAIEIWELTADAPEDRIADAQVDLAVADSEHSRITWSFETPALDWGKTFELKQLDGLEWWIDRLYGTVEFYLEYRPSSAACWTFWNRWTECAARNECELPNPLLPCTHPTQVYLPQYRQLMAMPTPPVACNADVQVPRPSNIDYSFQFRLTVRGDCRIRGYMAYAIPRGRAPFENLRCP